MFHRRECDNIEGRERVYHRSGPGSIGWGLGGFRRGRKNGSAKEEKKVGTGGRGDGGKKQDRQGKQHKLTSAMAG